MTFAIAFLLLGASTLGWSHPPEGRNAKVVGGWSPYISDYPWTVAVLRNGEYICGGSIISNRFILTAGECVDGANFTVRAGSPYHAMGGKIIKLETVIRHPDYDEDSKDYNIALLQTAKPIVFGPDVGPVMLPNEYERLYEDEWAVVTGWGVHKGERRPLSLQAVYIPTVSDENCVRYSYDLVLTDRMFCAGDWGSGTCADDTGSPLVLDHVQIGIASSIVGCGRPYSPSIFTNIATLRQWIASVARI